MFNKIRFTGRALSQEIPMAERKFPLLQTILDQLFTIHEELVKLSGTRYSEEKKRRIFELRFNADALATILNSAMIPKKDNRGTDLFYIFEKLDPSSPLWSEKTRALLDKTMYDLAWTPGEKPHALLIQKLQDLREHLEEGDATNEMRHSVSALLDFFIELDLRLAIPDLDKPEFVAAIKALEPDEFNDWGPELKTKLNTLLNGLPLV
ncbi:MAG TPA: hypothetical protein VFQ60_02395 [Patescibacteria group bacterium]|nr:hypothetical protein [Patescibacteria group bacterium]